MSDIQPVFKVAQVASMAGVSSAAVRNYVAAHPRHFSPQANPPAGGVRLFTIADARVIAYIKGATDAGRGHAAIAKELDGNALDFFNWSPVSPILGEIEEEGGALMAPDAIAALRLAMENLAARNDELQQRLDAKEAAHRVEAERLQSELLRLTAELGRASGELEARKRRRPAWWVSLFGE